jgi:hypothetical protein
MDKAMHFLIAPELMWSIFCFMGMAPALLILISARIRLKIKFRSS